MTQEKTQKETQTSEAPVEEDVLTISVVQPVATAPSAPSSEEEREEGELVEEIKKEVGQLIEKRFDEVLKEHMLVRLVVFDLPTEYRLAKNEFVNDGGVVRQVITFSGDPKEYRNLRVQFYDELNKCAFRTKMGWVLFRDPPPKLSEIMRRLNQLAGTQRTVEIIEVLAPRLWLKQELADYVNVLKIRLDDVKEKLADAAIKEATRRALEKKKEIIESVIRGLEAFAAKL